MAAKIKALEEKYRNENVDLTKRVDAESQRNIELSTGIKDFEAKIRAKEDQIMYMRKELEGARYSNSALLDNNSNLQVEIDSLNTWANVLYTDASLNYEAIQAAMIHSGTLEFDEFEYNEG